MNCSSEIYDLEHLRSIPITEVAEEFGTLVRKGSIYFTICPWHPDNNPSLALYERTNENKCYCFTCGGKRKSTIDLVMAHLKCDFPTACSWLGNRFGIPPINGKHTEVKHIPLRRKTTQLPQATAYVPKEWLQAHVTPDNCFCRCLAQLVKPEIVERITAEYLLGSFRFANSKNATEYVLFPSIDNHARIHNIKYQSYETDIRSPRFFHSNGSYWLGKYLQKHAIVSSEGETNTDCLFGEHLLQLRPSSYVALVESPKNALVGSAFCPELVWVATGNKNMLKRNILEPLRGRKVIVYPDRDAISDWKQILDRMSDLAYFQVSDFCEKFAPEDKLKYDIADFFIEKQMKYRQTPQELILG